MLHRVVQLAGPIGLSASTPRTRADEVVPTFLEEKVVGCLRPRQSSEGVRFADRKEPGINALVVTALLRSKRVDSADPAIVKGLGYLERFVDLKGGLAKAPHSVYSTSVALMPFQEANQGGTLGRPHQEIPGFHQGQSDRRKRGGDLGRLRSRRLEFRRRYRPT